MARTGGRCLCGEVRFSYEGPPRWVAYCHCESCRRATSGPVAVWIGVEKTAYRLDAGEPGAYRSSPGVVRRFCRTCGSPLSYEGDRWPNEIHLLSGSLDDPEVAAEVRVDQPGSDGDPDRRLVPADQFGRGVRVPGPDPGEEVSEVVVHAGTPRVSPRLLARTDLPYQVCPRPRDGDGLTAFFSRPAKLD